MGTKKKVVVIGGTGLVGAKVVDILHVNGHHPVVAAPSTGINAMTSEGLAEALSGADAVIDVSNIASFDAPVVRSFFETSSNNLLAAERDAGVGHHVVLSIVGADGLSANPYMAGKLAQEKTVQLSGQPYSIVRATQFYEFMETLADAYTQDGRVVVPDTLFQPTAAADVASALVRVALGAPANGTIDIAGPACTPFQDLMRAYLKGKGDPRTVSKDASLGYFGSPVAARSLVPEMPASIGETSLKEWLQLHNSSISSERENA